LVPEIAEFLILLCMPLFVEMMTLEWTSIGVCLVVALVVDILE